MQNPQLRHAPEAVKAILAASAMHNVEGAATLAGSTDTRDGAGGIDGEWAIEVPSSGALSHGTTAFHTGWLAQPKVLPLGITARFSFGLCVDSAYVLHFLDLWFRSPSPPYYNLEFASVSFDNNLEIIDFTAPETGWYTLEIEKALRTAPNAPPVNYGAAIVTTRPIYLPLLINQ